MESDQTYCHTCAQFKRQGKGILIWGHLFVCDECMPIIIKLHLFMHPVKWLCPHCKGAGNIKCNNCDLRTIFKRSKIV